MVPLPMSNYPPTGYAAGPGPGSGADDGSKDVTKSFVASAIGFLCCPILPFIFAIVWGGKALAKGNATGNVARIVAIVLLVLQIVGGFINFGRIQQAMNRGAAAGQNAASPAR